MKLNITLMIFITQFYKITDKLQVNLDNNNVTKKY